MKALSKSQKKKERKKKRGQENKTNELRVTDFLKVNSRKKAAKLIDNEEFIFDDQSSDVDSSDCNEDDYNTCNNETENENDLNFFPKVKETMAKLGVKSSDSTDSRSSSVKRAGSSPAEKEPGRRTKAKL